MNRLSRFWMIILGIVWLVACTPQAPLPTLAPTPLPPTNTPSPTITRTPTLTPTATQSVPKTESLDPTQQSYIRVVHIAQFADPIDVYLDGLNIAIYLELGQITPASGIVAGTYTLHIVPRGGRPGDGSLVQQPINIGGQQSLIVLVSGTLNAPQAQVLTEDISPLRDNESRIAVVNAIVAGPDFTLQLAATNTALTPILASGAVSPAALLPAGENELVLQSGETILRTFSARFRERQSYTFIVTGQGNDRESLNIISLNSPVNGIAQARAIHAAFGAERVDIYAGSIPLGANMDYGLDSPRQTLVSGVYDITVYPAGADHATTVPLVTQQIALNPNDAFTFIFIGEQDTFEIIPLQDTLTLTPLEEARITFMHTVPNVPTILLQGGEMPDQILQYGELSQTLLLPAQTTNFSWAVPIPEGVGDILEFGENMTLLPGMHYLYLFTGKRLGFPLIFEETVGAIVPTPDPNDFTPTPTQIPMTTLRVVNAAPGRFVDFRVDDVNFVAALPYQNGSNPIIILEGERVVTAHDQATGELLGRTIVNVLPNIQYSVYVSPTPGLGYNMTITEDTLPAANESVFLRLVNTSSVTALFGLGYADPSPGSDAVPVINPNVTPAEGEFVDDPYRRSLPFGTVRILDDIASLDASEFAGDRAAAGARDILIIDMYQITVAATIANVTLENNRYYDVVAFQQEGSTQVTAFVVPYPSLP